MVGKATPRRFESYEQAGAWLRATFGAWADNLSAAEHDAMCYYASPAYKALNLALREHRALSRAQERHVAALDRSLRVPLPEPVVAYRGLELERPVDFTARVGQPLVFRAYVSTSLLRSVAEGFCALAATKDHGVLFETVLGTGTRVGCPDLVQPTLEAELLLPRRQPLVLGGALAPARGRRYWTVTLHAADPLPAATEPGAEVRAEARVGDRSLVAPAGSRESLRRPHLRAQVSRGPTLRG